MTVVMDAGTGGGSRSFLPIADVINRTIDGSGDLYKILETPPLRGSNVYVIGTTKNTVDQSTDSFSETHDNLVETVDKTNSEQFSKNAEAVDAKDTMKTIVEDFLSLQTAIEDYQSQDIGRIVDQYNAQLKILKAKAQLKLMMQKADDINARAKKGTGIPWNDAKWFDSEVDRPYDHMAYSSTCWRHYSKIEEYWDWIPCTRYNDIGEYEDKEKVIRYRGTYQDFKYIDYSTIINHSTNSSFKYWPDNVSGEISSLSDKFNEVSVPYSDCIYTSSSESYSIIKNG